MTKKDYIKISTVIASYLKNNETDCVFNNLGQAFKAGRLIGAFSKMLKEDNQQFDSARFIKYTSELIEK